MAWSSFSKLFILTAGFEVFIHRKTFKIPDILISAVITGVYIATTAYLYIGPKTVADDKSFSYTKELLIINGFFLAGYFVLFLRHLKIKQKKGQMALLLLTMGLAMYECGSHMHETGLSLVNYQGYIKQDDSYAKIKAKLAKLNPEGSFYRMDQDNITCRDLRIFPDSRNKGRYEFLSKARSYGSC